MSRINQRVGLPLSKEHTCARKKSKLHLDLTPMVDLGFLLISFFMISTTWKTPTALKIYLPAQGSGPCIGESSSLTIIPLSNSQIFYYKGLLSEALRENQYGIGDFDPNLGIRHIIWTQKPKVQSDSLLKGRSRTLFVEIKPSSDSNFGTIIQLLDEMLINDITQYAVIDLDPGEVAWLRSKGLTH
jgi:hypothetical protein